MKNLIIIGSGGYGREIASAAIDCLGYGRDFILKGFLDQNPNALDGFKDYPPILGDPETYPIATDDVFFVAIGNTAIKRKNADLIANRGGRFQTLIHKAASLGHGVEIGNGCYIAHNAVLTADICLGDHIAVFHGSVIGHDGRVGDYSHISSLVFFGGGVRLGSGVTIHPGVRVVPYKTIGDNATVGIGSVVMTNIPAGETVFGAPAQNILA